MRNSPKRAALVLHAMHEQDRAWILARLGPESVARITPLLKEIEELGFSTESIDIRELLLAGEGAGELDDFCADELAAAAEKWGNEILPVLWSVGECEWKRELRTRLSDQELQHLTQRAEAVSKRGPAKARAAVISLARETKERRASSAY